MPLLLCYISNIGKVVIKLLNRDTLIALRSVKNSFYFVLRTQFLFHSNKLEGSTFSEEQLGLLADKNLVEGSHTLDDIIETRNSIQLFDFVIDTLNEPLTKTLLLEFHQILKKGTLDAERGFSGCWKKIPNMLMGVEIQLAQPWQVDNEINKLIASWNDSNKTIEDIAIFHATFEKIHPFQDGNGRIGRFLILKQCLENNVDLICIDNIYNKDYRAALYEVQLTGDIKELVDIFKLSQSYIKAKMQDINTSIRLLNSMNSFYEGGV